MFFCSGTFPATASTASTASISVSFMAEACLGSSKSKLLCVSIPAFLRFSLGTATVSFGSFLLDCRPETRRGSTGYRGPHTKVEIVRSSGLGMGVDETGMQFV